MMCKASQTFVLNTINYNLAIKFEFFLINSKCVGLVQFYTASFEKRLTEITKRKNEVTVYIMHRFPISSFKGPNSLYKLVIGS